MRAQAHTLEGFAAAVILLSGVVFALQATAVTPLTASTSNQHIENQQAAVAEGTLAAAEANGTLAPTLLHWNATDGQFIGAGSNGVYTDGPSTAFGATLNRTFGADRIAFNVEVGYRTADGERARERIVNMGEPSDNAVAAERTVVLFDDDPVGDGSGTLGEVEDDPNRGFYAPDADPDGPLYGVMEVRIVTWRI
ncbi:hypothetical protein Hbl1158_08040 [Halobaculum sp. CBA1158]|uniref:DUF7288 family protein n=1 Tax=Halobaculum sp. CBA1158 TaxID=2904243 RepID=UPI001F25A16C|nr:hypothetical protein [Halobaculum sp. CBA1158]UIP01254.1 hypothetical protein Hbl1158_08040 [Halobaculum sp. CBA1158]